MAAEAARGDEAALAAWGRAFARTLAPGSVVALSGELGAGKTTLVRAIAAGLGAAGPITSPTFALVHRYDGAGVAVYHVDAYRLRPTDDVRDLGFGDMLAESDAVILVEWPERLGPHAPDFTHHLTLEHLDNPNERRVSMTPATRLPSR